MKIIKRAVIDIASGCVIEKDCFDYDGPIAECKGSSSSKSYDEKYNKKMAAIATQQQKIANQYFKFWETTYKPYEEAQVAANMELMPYEVETQKLGLQARAEELQAGKPVMEEYYKQALEGIDVGEEVSRARADVAQGLVESEKETERTMSRLGVDPTSGRFAGAIKTSSLDKARAVGGAMSTARRYAKESNFQKLAGATQTFKGGINY